MNMPEKEGNSLMYHKRRLNHEFYYIQENITY